MSGYFTGNINVFIQVGDVLHFRSVLEQCHLNKCETWIHLLAACVPHAGQNYSEREATSLPNLINTDRRKRKKNGRSVVLIHKKW